MMELLCCELVTIFILCVLQLDSSCRYCYREMNQSSTPWIPHEF